jgi:predicted MFS family arabinose efflux permease
MASSEKDSPSIWRAASPTALYSLLILTIIGAVNQCDRQIISILAPGIKHEFHLSDSSLGLLLAAFSYLYALTGIFSGRVADRSNRVKLLSVALAVWSGFTMLCGVSVNFVMLFLARMGVGVGESVSVPATTSMIPDLFPRAFRGLAMSVLHLSVPLGGFLGLTIGGYVAQHSGWRAAFLAVGAPGFVIALLAVLTLRDRRTLEAAPKDRPSTSRAIVQLLGQPRFRWLIIAGICMTMGSYVSQAWLPSFLVRSQGMSLAQAGAIAGISAGTGGVAGVLLSGVICDVFRAHIKSIESKLMMVIFLLTIPLILVIVLVHSVAAISISMFFLAGLIASRPPVQITLFQSAAPAENRSFVVGLGVALSTVIGSGVGVPLVGAISDALKERYGPHSIGAALAGVMIFAGAMGVLAHWRAMSAASPADGH